MHHGISRWLRPTAGAMLALLLAAGCIDFQETMVIRRDGSGVIGLQYSLDEQLAGSVASIQKSVEDWQAGAAAAADKGKAAWIGSESAARKYFSGDGITLSHYAAASRDGRSIVQIVCDVANVQNALATGKFGSFTLTRNDKGDFLLHAELPDVGARPPISDARAEQFKALTRGLKLTLSVQTPGPILSATGAKIKDNRADWVLDAAVDDAFLRRMPRIDLVFSGIGVEAAKPAP